MVGKGKGIRGRLDAKTYGVLLGVSPPVGPAVPDSETQYVAPNLARTLVAKPATISVVGPR